MKLVDRHYVEKFYNSNWNDVNSGVQIAMVESRDPLLVIEEKDLVGFRFFDVGEMVSKSGRVRNFIPANNYSGMYYFGKRLSYQNLFLDAKTDPIKKLQLDYLNKYGIEEAIFCENAGKIVSCIHAGDKTIDEAKLERVDEQADTIFISQSKFFEGLAGCIEEHEGKTDDPDREINVIVSEVVCPLCDVGVPGMESDTAIVRTYDLYIGKHKKMSSSSVVKGDNVGCLGCDSHISLKDACCLVRPMYQNYPYLKDAIDDMKMAYANGEIHSEEAITGRVKK